MLNNELETRILGIAERICGPDCKDCKLSLIQNLQNRSRLYNSTNKRSLSPSNCLSSYYDALEFSSESLPRKYRKHLSNHHSKSKLLKDSYESKTFKRPESHTEFKKRKIVDIDRDDAELLLESIKRRIIDHKTTPSPSKKFEDLDKEKRLEKEYDNFINKVDLATVTEFIRADSILESASKATSDVVEVRPELTNVLPKQPFDNSSTIESQSLQGKAFSTETVVDEKPKSEEVPSDTPSKEVLTGSDKGFGSLFDRDLIQKPEVAKPLDVDNAKQESKPKLDLFDKTSTSKSLFSTETKKDDPFDIFHKINAPIPQGNPLFAPKQSDLSSFKPKTDGANFVFGQSSTIEHQPVVPTTNIFGNAQAPQVPQNNINNSQFVIPGFGQTAVQQPSGFNPFAGQFFKSKRGRGRGRGR